jgi:Protein of unknown function with PCYCGC motif
MATRSRLRTGILTGGAVIILIAVIGMGVYRVHAAHNEALVGDALTLNPDQFEGDTRQAYTVAQQHPELLAQLHCYCGCEQHDGHKSLLDCFRSTHGTSCEICIGEAVAAGKLADDGMPVEQIRETLRQRYAKGS